MHISWRLWLRISLIVIAAIVIWVRFASHRHPNQLINKPVTDLSATSPLNQPGGGISPENAYEVYSALYQARMQDPIAFAENSVTDIPQVNGSCLKPQTPDEREMTEAFVLANRQNHSWQRKFTIEQGYRLLPRGEVDHALTCLATHNRQGTAGCESYKDLRVVRFLGIPGFDQAHTRALVSVIKSCGGSCGSGGIFAVEKKDGTWQRLPTTDFTRDCSWMY